MNVWKQFSGYSSQARHLQLSTRPLSSTRQITQPRSKLSHLRDNKSLFSRNIWMPSLGYNEWSKQMPCVIMKLPASLTRFPARLSVAADRENSDSWPLSTCARAQIALGRRPKGRVSASPSRHGGKYIQRASTSRKRAPRGFVKMAASFSRSARFSWGRIQASYPLCMFYRTLFFDYLANDRGNAALSSSLDRYVDIADKYFIYIMYTKIDNIYH